MSARHVWTPAEDALLRDGHGKKSAAQIASELGLSVGAVYCRVSKLQLSSGRSSRPADYVRPVNPNSSWARMETLLAEHGSTGMTLVDAGTRMPEMPAKTINNTLNRLVVDGRAVKWGGGKSWSPRYFATAAHREAWLAANPAKVAAALAAAAGDARATAWRRPAVAVVPQGGPARLAGDPVITEKTRRIEAAKPLAHRFEVRGAVVGGLRTDGIGNYREPASGWAAAVAGGRA